MTAIVKAERVTNVWGDRLFGDHALLDGQVLHEFERVVLGTMSKNARSCEPNHVVIFEYLAAVFLLAAEAGHVLQRLVARGFVQVDGIVDGGFEEREGVLGLELLQFGELCFVLCNIHINKAAQLLLDVHFLGTEDALEILLVDKEPILQVLDARLGTHRGTLLHYGNHWQLVHVIDARLGKFPSLNSARLAVGIATAVRVASSRCHVAFAIAKVQICLDNVVAGFVHGL